jgi:hypothetical protein
MAQRPGRVSAALAALMFVLTGVLGVMHEATTTHVRCAAHGELVDSGEPAAVMVDSGESAAAVVVPACGTIASAPLLARGHGDEHCLLASAVRASRIAPRAPIVTAAIAAVDSLVTPPPVRAALRVAGVYRIAPKTSPPA